MFPLVVAVVVLLASSHLPPAESSSPKSQDGQIPPSGTYLSKSLPLSSAGNLPSDITRNTRLNTDSNQLTLKTSKLLNSDDWKSVSQNVWEEHPFLRSFHRAGETDNIIPGSTLSLSVQGYHKRSYWLPPNRYKRIRVCPFLNRVGFPLGGCLYSYIKPTYRPPPPPPKPAARTKPIPRPVIMWQPYQARWPEFYFLGGALGRR